MDASRPSESSSPDGTTYKLPTAAEAAEAFERLRRAAEEGRASGREVVVIQGLGFVGSAVAAAVAAARRADGTPRFHVIGLDLPTPGSYWKVGMMNAGLSPVASPDPSLDEIIRRAVREGNLVATTSEAALGLADVIVVDIHLDGRTSKDGVEVDWKSFEAAVRTIGSRMQPDALVLVETTIPVGALRHVILPALEAERARRGIRAPVVLAHAYERVMPGPRYLDSIRRFWRTFSGIDEASRTRARAFLSAFIDTDAFPLWEATTPEASEMGKLLENSYRAANIAFIHEWTLFAERSGVNLFEVVESVRVRKGTHDNIRQPGFGVGGYCLTKDGLLAEWASERLFGGGHGLPMTLEALRINERMPLHTRDLLREVLDGSLRGKRVCVLGASYLADVGDARYSPTATLVDAIRDEGGDAIVHDPVLLAWRERPDIPLTSDLAGALRGADAVVLAVSHTQYRKIAAELLLSESGPVAYVDASNVMDDANAARLRGAGARVAGVGKGHWRRARYHEGASA